MFQNTTTFSEVTNIYFQKQFKNTFAINSLFGEDKPQTFKSLENTFKKE